MGSCGHVGRIARARWEETSRLLDADERGIDFQHLHARVRALGEEWSQASQALDLLTNVTRACFSIQDLFAMMDRDGDGVVTQAEFSKVARKLLGLGVTGAQIELLFRAFDLDGIGVLTPQSIVDGLRVVDMWSAPLQHSKSTQPTLARERSSSSLSLCSHFDEISS